MTEVDEKIALPDVFKKHRIIQIAKEFHVSVESLIEFLSGDGFKVKNQMSQVTEEMYEKIRERYSKVTPDMAPVEDENEYQRKVHERQEKQRERLELIRQEIEEITQKKPPSLEEVRKQAVSAAEEQKVEAAKRKAAEKATKEKQKHDKQALETKRLEEEVAQKAAEEKKKKDLKTRRLERLLAVSPSDQPEVEEPEPIVAKRTASPHVEVPEKTLEEIVTAEQPVEVTAKPTTIEAEKPEVRVIKIGVDDKKERKPAEVIRPEERGRRRRKKKDRVAEEKQKAEQKVATKAKKKKKEKKRKVSDEEVNAAIKKTMAAMEDKGKPKRRRHRVAHEELVEEENAGNMIKVSEFISVAELARKMDVEPNEVIKKCLSMGMRVSINQRLDMDMIVMVADEFGFETEQEEMYGMEIIQEIEEEAEGPDKLYERPPVVTIMGHVDHGKTSLLDHIRSSNIIAGEIGGITQHIGAYVVNVDSKKITFLDTPGHEAFTAMRARGAQITDIVVLVVAADDRVMPQTIEAINHARAANVPIIVAINKIDKPGANPEMIKKQLADNNVLVEEWGGKYPSVEISAKTGEKVEQLLELLALQAELLELKANPDRLAKGVIIESELDKGRGPVATVLVQEGSLHVGDPVISGHVFGKVRAMFDERGNAVQSALPATPVQVLGFEEVLVSGDILHALKTERVAREISAKRQQLKREQDFRQTPHLTLDEFSKQMRDKKLKELKLIVKADVAGSAEALSDSLIKLSNDEITVKVIHKGVGAITETDALLASASEAIIIGFQIRPNAKAWQVAEREKVDIRTYSIIYDAIDDVKRALEGLLEPEEKEELVGVAEIRDVFRIPKVGNIAGAYVQSGKIGRNDNVRIVREGRVVYEGQISSLRRFKEDSREVQNGYECGVGIQDFNDIKVGDSIEAFKIVQIQKKYEEG